MQQTAVLSDVLPLTQPQIALELTVAKARELLDWLEAHGIDQFEIKVEESGKFTITWNEQVAYPSPSTLQPPRV
jgi:hypothetical protein